MLDDEIKKKIKIKKINQSKKKMFKRRKKWRGEVEK